MKRRRIIQILSFSAYLLTACWLAFSLFQMRDHVNWVAGGIREVLTYLLIGITGLFSIFCLLRFIKTRNKKIIFLLLIGISPCILSIPYFNHPSFKTSKELTGKKEKIELQYVAWSCYCPRWIYPGQMQLAAEVDSLCMHVEPISDSIAIPDSLLYSGNIFRFTGEFYRDHQYGGGIEDGGRAKTFRYEQYQLIDTTGIWSEKVLESLNMESGFQDVK